MKRTIASLLFAGMVGTCQGQGMVNWDFISPASMTAQTNSMQFSPLFGGGTNPFGNIGDTAPPNSGLIYYYELLYNTSFTGSQAPVPSLAGLLNGTWLDTGLTATNSNVAGRLVPVNPTVAARVPWANGVTNNILLVGWSANLGTSWATVSNTLANYSWPNISSDLSSASPQLVISTRSILFLVLQCLEVGQPHPACQ